MYKLTHCPACFGTNTTARPARLSKFTAWRITGTKPDDDLPNELIECTDCSFRGSNLRFADSEEIDLYQGYRGKIYNQQREECEPGYFNKILFDVTHIEKRKQFINTIIQNNIDISTITSVLDYGGDTGSFIPEFFANINRYVYDISGIEPLPGILKFNHNVVADLVMCCQVLEHKSNIDTLIDELKKYSNKWIYIEVPGYQQPPPNNVIITEHVNFFNQNSLSALLSRHSILTVNTQVDYSIGVLGILGKI